MLTNTILFKHYIYNNFLEMLKPLIFFQNIFLVPKFSVKDSFIFPNTTFVKVVSAGGLTLLFLLVMVYRSINTFINSKFENGGSNAWLTLYSTSHYFIGFFLLYKSSVIDSSKHVELIIRLQRSFDVNFSRSIYKNVSASTWIIYCIDFIFHLYLSITSYLSRGTVFISISLFSIQTFDVIIIYASRMIMITRLNLELWTLKLKSGLKQKSHNLSRRQQFEDHLEDVYEMYLDITEIFKCINKRFEKMVSSKLSTTSKQKYKELIGNM